MAVTLWRPAACVALVVGFGLPASAQPIDRERLKARDVVVKDWLTVRKVYDATLTKAVKDNETLKKEVDRLAKAYEKVKPPSGFPYSVTDPRFGTDIVAKAEYDSANKQYDQALKTPEIERVGRELKAAQGGVDRVDQNLLGRPPRPTVAKNYLKLVGTSVDTGQCVVFVQKATGLPKAENWRVGIPVKGANIPVGTAIATFDENGRYANKPHGNHAAVYDSQDSTGIWVYDQYVDDDKPRKVDRRQIRFKNGQGKNPSSDGDAFSVIEK